MTEARPPEAAKDDRQPARLPAAPGTGLPWRSVEARRLEVDVRTNAQGHVVLESRLPLQTPPPRMLDRLLDGAESFPDRLLIAGRGADGHWAQTSWAEMLERIRPLAQGLLGFGLGAERPLLILSDNSVEHFTLALAAQYAGIPVCAVAPAYSLGGRDTRRLQQVVDRLTPGLIYAEQVGQLGYAAAIDAVLPAGASVLGGGIDPWQPGGPTVADLLQTRPTTVDQRFAGTGPQTIARFLFTSGSSGLPKAVPITQRMWCANQQMLRQSFPFLARTPPVLLDWMPWSHSFGANFTTGMTLYNGGSFHLDDGGPTPERFARTLRNLQEVSPTLYVSVPRMWAWLVEALETDPGLRHRFLDQVRMFFFGAAALSDAVSERLDAVVAAHCGERIGMYSGLGMTEVCSVSTFTDRPVEDPGWIGLPAPGCQIKLVPRDGGLEACFKGANLMEGYWRPEPAAPSPFDEDGYYRSGDALRWLDPARPEAGLVYDGRLGENFKLATGTFVQVASIRDRALIAGDPWVTDVVVTAPGASEPGLLVFPNQQACRALAARAAPAVFGERTAAGSGDRSAAGSGVRSAAGAGDPNADAFEDVLASPAVQAVFRALLETLSASGSGTTGRIHRLRLQTVPPSAAEGEVTEKGSLNPRRILQRRAGEVVALYGQAAGSVGIGVFRETSLPTPAANH